MPRRGPFVPAVARLCGRFFGFFRKRGGKTFSHAKLSKRLRSRIGKVGTGPAKETRGTWGNLSV